MNRTEADAKRRWSFVRHSCGYPLLKTEVPELYDVTCMSDVPEAFRFEQLDNVPGQYHQFIIIGTLMYWHDTGDTPAISQCPQCQENLSYHAVGWQEAVQP